MRRKVPQFVIPRTTPPEDRIRAPVVRAILLDDVCQWSGEEVESFLAGVGRGRRMWRVSDILFDLSNIAGSDLNTISNTRVLDP